jgi:hypothetical protein
MDVVSLGLVGLAYSLFQSIPWTILYIPLRWCGIRVYTLTNRLECQRIQTRTRLWSSHTTDFNRGFGYTFGKWYIAYIDEVDGSPTVWIMTTPTCFKKLTKCASDDADEEEEEETIDEETGEITEVQPKYLRIFEKCGNYNNIYYNVRDHKHFELTARPTQEPILQDILSLYATKKFIVAFIHGPPSTGKSILGVLLADHFKSTYTNTFSPWEPGDTMSNLMEEAQPTKDRPLIISFDEIDIPLTNIHAGISSHPKVSTAICDKVSWNRFFDNFQRGLYYNVILLLTSNKGPDYFIGMDRSYMKPERIDRTYEMVRHIKDM